MHRPLALLTVLSLGVPAPGAQDDPRQWVYFDSRDADRGPRLVLTLAGGERPELAAGADTTLISYLADRAWGGLPSLSISLGDTNRVLIQFPMDELAAAERAELVLSTHLSQIPPVNPFELAVHRIEEEWSERSTTWGDQPAFADEAALVVEVEPVEGELRLDVTELVDAWLADPESCHGLLLKVARPLASRAGSSGVGEADELLLAGLPWAESLEAALAASEASGRPVLALVTGAWSSGELNLQEELLLSVVFAHPALRRLVEVRTVPVRLSYRPVLFAYDEWKESTPDPLAPLGAGVHAAKAPALIVSRGGRELATLASIGTYGEGRVYRFLVEALGTGEPPADVADPWQLLGGGWLGAAEEAFRRLGGAEGHLGRSAVADRRGDHAAALRWAERALAAGEAHAGAARARAGVALMLSLIHI